MAFGITQRDWRGRDDADAHIEQYLEQRDNLDQQRRRQLVPMKPNRVIKTANR